MTTLEANLPEPCGVLAVDKPLGWTSRDVVNKVGRWLGSRSVGHAGTLDPQASGVLIIAAGEATKLVSRLTDAAKDYDAEIVFGTATHTDDASGRTVRTAPLPAGLTRERLQGVLDSWLGDLMQVPPQVSALQRAGVRDHARVRQGETVVRDPRPVKFYAATVHEANSGRARVSLRCGAGFYVRALARDLGEKLGSAGHLATLRRTSAGGFSLQDAYNMAQLEKMTVPERHALLLPLLAAGERFLPVLRIDGDQALALRQGRQLPAPVEGEGEWLAVCDQTAIAIVAASAGVLTVVRGFAHEPLKRAAAVQAVA